MHNNLPNKCSADGHLVVSDFLSFQLVLQYLSLHVFVQIPVEYIPRRHTVISKDSCSFHFVSSFYILWKKN